MELFGGASLSSRFWPLCRCEVILGEAKCPKAARTLRAIHQDMSMANSDSSNSLHEAKLPTNFISCRPQGCKSNDLCETANVLPGQEKLSFLLIHLSTSREETYLHTQAPQLVCVGHRKKESPSGRKHHTGWHHRLAQRGHK